MHRSFAGGEIQDQNIFATSDYALLVHDSKRGSLELCFLPFCRLGTRALTDPWLRSRLAAARIDHDATRRRRRRGEATGDGRRSGAADPTGSLKGVPRSVDWTPRVEGENGSLRW